mmetsp:Transcript_681/g.2047  ORF Transcript_681/g.2047 Transcript_681/m.2047 type:complete len:202 (+) Transcript_681:227-832(+)
MPWFGSTQKPSWRAANGCRFDGWVRVRLESSRRWCSPSSCFSNWCSSGGWCAPSAVISPIPHRGTPRSGRSSSTSRQTRPGSQWPCSCWSRARRSTPASMPPSGRKASITASSWAPVFRGSQAFPSTSATGTRSTWVARCPSTRCSQCCRPPTRRPPGCSRCSHGGRPTTLLCPGWRRRLETTTGAELGPGARRASDGGER